MKVLVTGDRNWTKISPIRRELKKLPENTIIIHGAAHGVDEIADLVAKSLGFERKSYPAEWEKYKPKVAGRKNPAGPIRNRQMLLENPDIELVLAFHEHIEESKGTKDMISIAEKAKIEVRLFIK